MEDYTFTYRTEGSYPKGKYHVHLSDDNTLRMAIYGDSFGDAGFVKLEPGVRNIERWWTTIVAKKMQARTVDNYSAARSPFIFSYENFLNNYKKYDINIVLVTQPGRYTKPIRFSTDPPRIKNNPQFRGPNINTLEWFKQDKTLSKEDITLIDNIINWHMTSDPNFMKTAHNLMIKDILQLAPNTILVPCFADSMDAFLDSTNCVTGYSSNCLAELVVYQNRLLGIDQDQIAMYNERNDVIACHFTPEMNIAVADLIYERITTGKWNWHLPKVKHEHTHEYYYTLDRN